MKYTLFNSGNAYHFNPKSKIYPPNNGTAMLAVDYWKEWAAWRNDPSIFIYNEYGKLVK